MNARIAGHLREVAGRCGKLREDAGSCGKMREDAGICEEVAGICEDEVRNTWKLLIDACFYYFVIHS